MKIAFVCNEYPPTPHGGIGSFVHGLAHQLAIMEQQVYVIGYDPRLEADSHEKDGAVEVVRLASPYREGREIKLGRYRLSARILLERAYLSRRVDALVSQHHIDLVESYDWSGPLCSPPGVPLVVRMHGANTAYRNYEQQKPSRLLRFFERRNVQLTDHLVAVSVHIGKVTLQALGLEHKAYEVIYNGVDCELFHDQGIPRSPAEILFVGNVSRRKGIFELFQAYAQVWPARPDALLTIVGALPKGETRQALINELLELLPEAARGNVRFVGRVERDCLPKIYNQATLAVFPSLAEAFGLTCAEAMACGTPVIMTAAASGPELVEDGVSGLLVDVRDAQAFSEAILNLLQHADLRKALGNHARARVLEKFDLQKLARHNLVYYQTIIADGK